jgi:hypothetical protein
VEVHGVAGTAVVVHLPRDGVQTEDTLDAVDVLVVEVHSDSISEEDREYEENPLPSIHTAIGAVVLVVVPVVVPAVPHNSILLACYSWVACWEDKDLGVPVRDGEHDDRARFLDDYQNFHVLPRQDFHEEEEAGHTHYMPGDVYLDGTPEGFPYTREDARPNKVEVAAAAVPLMYQHCWE